MDATQVAATKGKASLELSGDVHLFINRFGSGGDLPAVVISLELKILSALVVLFLFLLFLIAVLWDRYGKEISELYTPGGGASRGDVNGAYMDSFYCRRLSRVLSIVSNSNCFCALPVRHAADVNVNDVADEYTVYQKLPTFFYEYTRKKRN